MGKEKQMSEKRKGKYWSGKRRMKKLKSKKLE